MYSHVNKDIRFDEIEIDKKKNNSSNGNKNSSILDQSSDTDTDINSASPLNNNFVLKKSANPLLILSDNNNFTLDDETQKMDEAFSSVDSKCDLLLNSNIVNVDIYVPGVTIDQIEEESNVHIVTSEEEAKKEEEINEEINEEKQFFGFKPFE
jgi:hypothetical protein